MAKRAWVTLTTDFGTSDPYVAAMKGNILRHGPRAEIIDITHDIPPHQIAQGAFVLANAAPWFPAGTVHVVVVDPGVGTDRAILVGQFGGQLFIFPDNGIITFIQQTLPMEGLVSVKNLSFLKGAKVSNTFHGRDLMAPLAGYVLSGKSIADLGMMPTRYKLLDLPQAYPLKGGLAGQVIYVDRFGNIVTNITREQVESLRTPFDTLHVDCNGQHVSTIRGTYGFVDPGLPVSLFNSMDRLEIAINQSRACDVFHGEVGSEIRVYAKPFIEAS